MAVWKAAHGNADQFERPKEDRAEVKQRMREYRIAARREKRSRKSDEKKQRTLNATILRRMTKNPMKYNTNIQRNRTREVIGERKRIWSQAIKQAQRLAAVHDPSGASFNIEPVTTLENGDVITVEALKRKEERENAQKEAGENRNVTKDKGSRPDTDHGNQNSGALGGVNQARVNLIKSESRKPHSKTQLKKLAKFEPTPPPPKPCIPKGVTVPDGEENWLALWDLSDEQMERRVLAEKKRKAAERKAFRLKQQELKDERRAARDEKRRKYRDTKESWKVIKAKESELKRRIESVIGEEARKVAVRVNIFERKVALERCAELGFTLQNVPGVEDVKPKISGVKGRVIDFDKFEFGKDTSELKLKSASSAFRTDTVKASRVNLGAAPEESSTIHVSATGANAVAPGDFISFGTSENDREFQEFQLNHKLRRKILRSMQKVELDKEALVRQAAKEHCEKKGIPVPAELNTLLKVKSQKGRRILPDGTIETDKQARVRARVELLERNTYTKVLRVHAKDLAIKSGLETYAQLTGKIPKAGKEKPDSDMAESNGDRSSDSSTDGSSEGEDGPLPKRRKSSKSSPSSGGSGSENSDESEESEESEESDDESERSSKSSSYLKPKVSKPEIRTQLRASNWNSEALGGDKGRKDKFLRLLGAGKSANTNGTNGIKSTEGTSEISQRETELERQFEAGRHLKVNGKKRGLGA